MFFIFIGVIIEMNTVANFVIGSNASVTCRTDIDATKMEWLNSKSEVIASVAGQNNLTLMFSPVHDANHSEVYTCRVTRNDGMGKENVTVNQTFTLEAQCIIVMASIYCTILHTSFMQFHLNQISLK